LWNAVLDYVQAEGTVARADILLRFCKDDSATVKSVLNDLVEAGFVFAKGRGDGVAFRAASPAELSVGTRGDADETCDSLVWILVARHSPIGMAQLLELSQLEARQVEAALERLLADGRINQRLIDGEAEYTSDGCVIPLGQSVGWEASVFDHYQAVVTAICAKLALGNSRSERGEAIGGSTYSMDVWPGHPLFDEALGLLQLLRNNAAGLRTRVDEMNRSLARPNAGVRRVVTYVGQNVTDSYELLETVE